MSTSSKHPPEKKVLLSEKILDEHFLKLLNSTDQDTKDFLLVQLEKVVKSDLANERILTIADIVIDFLNIISGLAAVGFIGWVGIYFLDKGNPGAGAAIISASIVSLAIIFRTGSSANIPNVSAKKKSI